MPLITNHKDREVSKRFQKKSYRPWDDESLITNPQIITNNSANEDSPPNGNNINDIKNASSLNKNDIFTDDLTEVDLKKELRDLFGAQKTIIQYLLQQIEEDNNEYLVTKAISMEEFKITCNLTPNTVKGMLQKLKTKKLLKTYENKPGRGGYARYTFGKNIYTFFLNHLIL